MTKARVVLVVMIALFVVACDRYVMKEAVVFVSPQTVQCGNSGMVKSPNTCLQISENSTGPFFLNQIVSFNHETGFRYKLRIRASWQTNETDIGEHSILELLETLEKTPVK
jgi:Domain of unknown function (DUF4377)